MLVEQVQADQLSNDLANASTPGFKASSSVQTDFGAMLLHNTLNGKTIGTIWTGVESQKGVTDLAQGPLDPIGRDLDFAISGQGFFAVKTATGVEYTRNGEFSKNNQGILVDQYGDPVLSATGGTIPVGADGTVPTSALGVFDVANPSQLGNNNFSGNVVGRGTGQVYSGELEGSSVDAIQGMVQLESALDAYTAGQTTIGDISQTLNTGATEVAALP